ncbi:ureidoglycolate dehydrogenase (NAD+) [Peribacillus deserti]|uniref:Ureidoglycolate dehydrogenase (NAD+) n=1 Tax=Peribacillus deserti TaxID=673318 RepID=A0ABS2QFW1_9BACI|nr:Ldh family oxidoreductase [Peribacillus deserti]MBM7691694.1 ureidoglycolate dehydrogenase (NAD+) [Peribacillus deserti]
MINLAEERVQSKDLENLVEEIFLNAGLDRKQALSITKHLVNANLRGVDSHGVSRVGIYTKRLEQGLVNREFNPIHSKETPVSLLIDAQNCSGIPIAHYGMKKAIQKAKKSGIGMVGIQNSNHCGMLADYTRIAVENDCIAIATTNAPSTMPPWGAKERFFGTNPISYGIPAGQEKDIIFDMATSKVARGKIILAEKRNQQIPLGWALSSEGTPTSDPKEAINGVVLPVGEHKGYGIAFLVECLSSLFTGAAYGPFIGDLYNNFIDKQNVGQFFLVMRADLFQDLDVFKHRIDQMIREIRALPLMEGVEKIYLPGEIEMENELDRRKNGIPLGKETVSEIVTLAQKYNIKESLIDQLVT